MSEQRGIGTTTNQIKSAPRGAVFIWPVANSIDYPQRIARELGRQDLIIKSVGAFEDPHWAYGREFPELILDHAISTADWSDRQWHGYRVVLSRVREPFVKAKKEGK